MKFSQATNGDGKGLSGYFLDLAGVAPGEAVVRDGDGWLYFRAPSGLAVAGNPDQVLMVLDRAQTHVDGGGWAVGFVAFDAGPSLNPAIQSQVGDRPLAWFALFDEAPDRYRELGPHYDPVTLDLAPLEFDEATYRNRFERVKDALERGESYQINLTMRQQFGFESSPAEFFAARCGVRPPPYATYINGGDWVVASFSPEQFFERVGDEISSKPMKGTVVRPKTKDAEAAAAAALAADPKSIAENIMIVDMVRNDLGSIAEVGTVKAPRLLQVERHRDLLQMTSTVTARTSVPTTVLFQHMFPPASVTGAPKIATCRLIAELEDSPRGIYCGAIGFMAPGRERFNVAIRTAWIDAKSGRGEFGIGSGLVWDSEPDQEYAECLAKRDFLLNSGEQWVLIEAIPGHELRNPDVVGRHLRRLSASASELRITPDLDAVRGALDGLAVTHPEGRTKIRLAVQADGMFSVQISGSAISGSRLTASLAASPVDCSDPNLQMKTNSRAVYDRRLNEFPEAEEVLLHNQNDELTEFCRGNVVLKLNGRLVTPDPIVGCLPGVGIARMVESGEVVYARPTVGDLGKCEEIWFVNSVTGLIPVEML